MKKIKLTIIMMLLIIGLTGCTTEVESVSDINDTEMSMFVEIETAGTWKVVYHRDTKVMYTVSRGSYNHGNFTLLVDADGKPLLYEGN